MRLQPHIWQQLAGDSAEWPALSPLGQDRGMSAQLHCASWNGRTAVLKVSGLRTRSARERDALQLLNGVDGTPRLLGVAETPEQVWLLLEDLRALTPGDILTGPSDRQALAAMRLLGRLHRRWWNAPPAGWDVQGMRWLSPDATRLEAFEARFPHSWSGLSRLPQAIDEARSVLTEMPVCLTHADAHLDNWMFGPAPMLIDWETARVAPGIIDVVRFLIEGVHTRQRRRLQAELLDAWRAELPAITDNQMSDWLRAALWYSLNAVVNHHGSVDLTQLSPRMRAVHAHCAQQIMDLAADLL